MVTDPHYNTLVSHEIIGHPVELDRALKMETAYAGRSWLLRGLDDHQVGQRIASPLVTAYSDPSLPGYGHYAYDHEGTPAARVTHIDRGVFRGFMNSRQTAAIFGGAPNGHWKATEAALVPLIRMSTTVFAGGDRDPADIIGEVDHGYYLVGHRTPSIAESRENFRISARKVYEIVNGQLGRLYRDGGIMADTRDYLMKVDAVGRTSASIRFPTAARDSPCRPRSSATAAPRCGAAPVWPEARPVRTMFATLLAGGVLLLAPRRRRSRAPGSSSRSIELKTLLDSGRAPTSSTCAGTPSTSCTSRARAQSRRRCTSLG